MITTLSMECRDEFVADGTKLFMPCKEITDSGTPCTVPAGVYYDSRVADGTLTEEIANAIHIQNPTDNVPVPFHHNITCSTRKVIILAACVNVLAENGTRVSLGALNTAVNGVLTLSCGGQMHHGINVAGTNYGLENITDAYLVVDDTVVLRIVWNGLTKVLESKVLNLDGSIYNPTGSIPFVITSGVLEIPEDTVTFDNEARLTDAHYYNMVMQELDSLPDNLDYKLAQWGTQSVAGYKGSPTL